MSSPTQRTLKRLRDDGWTAAVVEKWNPHAKIRQDLFGFVDVLGIREGETIAVQACSYGDVSKRVNKIAEHRNTAHVRKAGWAIEVHGWRKVGARWACRVVDCS